MKLTKRALAAIKDAKVRRELQATLDCTEQTIIRYIKTNDPNGPLTTAGALQTIKKETGLTDKQILEQEPVKA
jgi:hypothetical protein